MHARRLARVLVVVGTAVAVLGLGKYHARFVGRYDYTGSVRFAWSLAYVALLCVTAYGLGLPDLVRGRRATLTAAVGTATGAAVGVSVCQLLAGSALLPRLVVFGAAALVVPWYAACAAVASGGRIRAEDRDRVVLVARRDEADALREELGRNPERHASLVAHLTLDEARAGIGRPLNETVSGTGASVVVLARDAQADESVVAQAAELHERGVRVRTLSMFYEQWLGKLPVPELERVSLMFDIGELHRARYGRMKRLADVTLALLALPALAVAVPLVAVANRFGNRGPLFYRQPRVGRSGQTFEILKFRTMRPPSAADDTAWTGEGDPRITPFGRFMRRTHVDEIPQLVNILRGELSIVGPRPEQPRYVDELAAKLPFYDLRHLVRPGLTGWAQVKYGYAGSATDALEKLQYEFFYLRHQGFGIDARIVGRTLRSILGRRGR